MTDKPKYHATATPEGKFWVIKIDGLPDNLTGVTQAMSDLDIEEMTRDCIALLLDVDPGSFDVEIEMKEGDSDG